MPYIRCWSGNRQVQAAARRHLQDALARANQQRDDASSRAHATSLRLHEAQQQAAEAAGDRQALADKLAALQAEHDRVGGLVCHAGRCTVQECQC